MPEIGARVVREVSTLSRKIADLSGTVVIAPDTGRRREEASRSQSMTKKFVARMKTASAVDRI